MTRDGRPWRAPRCRPLGGGKVFRRASLAFSLRCAPVARPRLDAFTTRALALRRPQDQRI